MLTTSDMAFLAISIYTFFLLVTFSGKILIREMQVKDIDISLFFKHPKMTSSRDSENKTILDSKQTKIK